MLLVVRYGLKAIPYHDNIVINTMQYGTHRTYKGGPWAYCQRCGTKTLVGQLKRQAGILACYPNGCVDNQIIGQREARLARIVQQLPGQEMQPVPKVTMENDSSAGLEAIEFGF